MELLHQASKIVENQDFFINNVLPIILFAVSGITALFMLLHEVIRSQTGWFFKKLFWVIASISVVCLVTFIALGFNHGNSVKNIDDKEIANASSEVSEILYKKYGVLIDSSVVEKHSLSFVYPNREYLKLKTDLVPVILLDGSRIKVNVELSGDGKDVIAFLDSNQELEKTNSANLKNS